jgi:integrase
MRWSELDLEKQLWTLPEARTKNQSVHDVALTPKVVELIEGCPRGVGQFVASLSADQTFKGWSKAKVALDQKSKVTDWRLHDLRRTMVTYMAQSGYLTCIRSHPQSQIGRYKACCIYQRHVCRRVQRRTYEMVSLSCRAM